MLRSIPFLIKTASPGLLNGQMNCLDDIDKLKGNSKSRKVNILQTRVFIVYIKWVLSINSKYLFAEASFVFLMK